VLLCLSDCLVVVVVGVWIVSASTG
jgi:hypothetical protein